MTGDLKDFPYGPTVFGIASTVLGIVGLIRGDFTVVWHPVPPNIPAREALAYLSSFLLLAGGLAVLVRRFRTAGGLLLAILYPLLGLQWLVRVVSFPELIGTWIGFVELCALSLGGLMIALHAMGTSRRGLVTCRVIFGLFQIAFGLGHFFSLKETAAMTPPWLPPDQTFWALATGAVHVLGGVAFILGVWPRAVAASLAFMFAGFALLVWLPAIHAAPSAPVPLAGFVVTMALTGAMLALFDLLRRPRLPRSAEGFSGS